MKEIEFNLIDEPWIRVMDSNCKACEVSLKDALLNAHKYRSLSGELPTQDITVMRLMLAVLHTVYSRVDENGDESPLEEFDDDEEEVLDRWKALWERGSFSEKAIGDYLDRWHERFWLFHPDRPFYQITKSKMGKLIKGQKQLLLSKFNGEISKSSNKNNIFASYSGSDMDRMSYAEAARWLVFTNSYDDTAFKPQGKDQRGNKLPTASVGWLGQIGLIYLIGDTLFETLMLNLALINHDHVEFIQKPIWEMESIRFEERVNIGFPSNLAELYTLQSRRVHLFRDNGEISYFHILAGDLVASDTSSGDVLEEPMTAWKKGTKEDKTAYVPRLHDSPQLMWKEFSSLYNRKDEESAGIIKWYRNYLLPYFKSTGSKRILKTSIVALEYDSSASHKFLNFFSDSLTMHADLLTDLGAGWRNIIETEIDSCSQLANAIAFLAQNLYVASGGSNSKKDKHFMGIPANVKSQLYYRLDVPFREWLRSIDPDNRDQKQISEKQKEWQKKAQEIALDYAHELVSETDESVIVGRKVEEIIYSSPKAINIFRGQMNKIYIS